MNVVFRFKPELEPYQKSLTHSICGKTFSFEGDGEFTVTRVEWLLIFERLPFFEFVREEAAEAPAEPAEPAANAPAEPVAEEAAPRRGRRNGVSSPA